MVLFPLSGFQFIHMEGTARSSIPPRRNHATLLLQGIRGAGTHLVAESLLYVTCVEMLCLGCNLGGCLVRVDGIQLSKVFVSGFRMITNPAEL